MPKRITVKSKPYDVLETLLENAVKRAVYRTWKHRDEGPPSEDVIENLVQQVSTYFWSEAEENGVTFE